MRNASAIACLSILLSFDSIITASAQNAQTVLKRKGREPELVDSAVFHNSKDEYQITIGSGKFTVPARDLDYVKPPKPKGFDQCRDIAELEKIVQDYQRLWWDVEAFKRLLPLYVKKGEHAKAVKLCRNMKPVMGQDMPIPLRRDYWEALRLSGEKTALEEELKQAVTSESPELAAWAYLARGDLLAGQGSTERALLEGYLKTVILFQDVRTCRREALEKTIAAMDQLRDPRAETFRKALQTEFPKPE